jgi:hypothetical protein
MGAGRVSAALRCRTTTRTQVAHRPLGIVLAFFFFDCRHNGTLFAGARSRSVEATARAALDDNVEVRYRAEFLRPDDGECHQARPELVLSEVEFRVGVSRNEVQHAFFRERSGKIGYRCGKAEQREDGQCDRWRASRGETTKPDGIYSFYKIVGGGGD